MKVRTYYGHIIHPATGDMRINGFRWWAIVDGLTCRADTLAGIKELIRHRR